MNFIYGGEYRVPNRTDKLVSPVQQYLPECQVPMCCCCTAAAVSVLHKTQQTIRTAAVLCVVCVHSRIAVKPAHSASSRLSQFHFDNSCDEPTGRATTAQSSSVKFLHQVAIPPDQPPQPRALSRGSLWSLLSIIRTTAVVYLEQRSV